MPRRPRSTAIPTVHPQPENYHGNVNPVGPRSCYDEGKRFAETLVTDFGGGTAGRRASPASSTPTGRACSPMTAAWCRTSSSRRCSAGHHRLRLRRADPFVLFRERPDRGICPADGTPGRVLAPVNLGNPVETTVGELAEIIVDIVGSRSQGRLSSAAGRRSPATPSRYRACAGPCSAGRRRSSSLTGLRETIAYFDDQLRRHRPPSDRRFLDRRSWPVGADGRRASMGGWHEIDDRWFGLCRAGRRCLPFRTWPRNRLRRSRCEQRSRACGRASCRSSSPGSKSCSGATPPPGGSPSQATSPN